MEGLGGFSFSGTAAVAKKPRTTTARRPRPDSHSFFKSCDGSPPSSTPSSDIARKHSPDENTGYATGSRKKEFYLNDHAPRVPSSSRAEGTPAYKKIRKDDRSDGFNGSGNGGSRRGQSGHTEQRRKVSTMVTSKESSEMQLGSPDGYWGKSEDAGNIYHSAGDLNVSSAENRLRKVKLKVGGVTRTIHAKSNEDAGNGGHEGSSSAKTIRSLDASRSRQKPFQQDNSGSPPRKGIGLEGKHQKVFSSKEHSHEAKDKLRRKLTEESLHGKQTNQTHTLASNEPIRKSNRVPKRRVLDGTFGEAEEDDKNRYLERSRISKVSTDYTVEQENIGEDARKRKSSKSSKSRNSLYGVDEEYGLSRQSKDSRKKLRSGKESDDTYCIEEEENAPDDDPEPGKKNKVPVEPQTDVRTESLTTRQRALQSGKGGASSIEFPDGLPPPPSRKQKDKLTEEERQAKKAEQALRRKLQVEKQAKEEEDAAIRKIRGLDSDRRKEEKNQKDLEEKARAAKSQALDPNTVRWIMGPTGTVVIFPEDMELPSIFNSKPCSYPPPREKCAGPSCTNAYKYRDSRSNLPLCSLQCYKAVHGSVKSVC